MNFGQRPHFTFTPIHVKRGYCLSGHMDTDRMFSFKRVIATRPAPFSAPRPERCYTTLGYLNPTGGCGGEIPFFLHHLLGVWTPPPNVLRFGQKETRSVRIRFRSSRFIPHPFFVQTHCHLTLYSSGRNGNSTPRPSVTQDGGLAADTIVKRG